MTTKNPLAGYRRSKSSESKNPFRHDAGAFSPNGVSRRTLNGMITPNPRCSGVWGVIGKRVEVETPNGVSAKCAISIYHPLSWWTTSTGYSHLERYSASTPALPLTGYPRCYWGAAQALSFVGLQLALPASFPLGRYFHTMAVAVGGQRPRPPPPALPVRIGRCCPLWVS
jgi:hypothetical protein